MTVYKAAPSRGWLWLLGTGVLMLLLALPAVLTGQVVAMVISLVAVLPFALAFVLLALWFPTMRYELSPQELTLRYGPFRWRIPLRENQEVSKRNLAFSPLSSMRLPGFAMFGVHYADQGIVQMCATRSLEQIILIVTPKRKYGITPRDEDAFLAQLQRYLQEG
jgi:hypothetical protein